MDIRGTDTRNSRYNIGQDINGQRLYLSFDQDAMIWQPDRSKAERYTSVARAQHCILELSEDYSKLFVVDPSGIALAWQRGW